VEVEMSGDVCPTVSQLKQWLDSPQGQPQQQALARHVDVCPHCQRALEEMTTAHAVAAGAALSAADADLLRPLKQELPARLAGGASGPREARAADGPAGRLVLPLPGALPSLEGEVRLLLRRRLLVVSVVAGVTFLGLLLLWASGWANPALTRFGDALGVGLAAAAVVVSLGCAAALALNKGLSLAALRALEALTFTAAVAFFTKFRYSALTGGLEGPWEGPGHRALFITQATMTSNFLFNFLIVSYGVFIPNTWRRCVVAVAALAVAPLTVTVLAGLRHEPVRAQLPFLLASTGLGLFAASAVAVFGSFKLSRLSQEAFLARQLGPYRLQRLLGRGGMGEVYLAEHRLLKRPCAVKLIRPEQAGDPDLLRRFEREVQATARLGHPNTVEVYDYGHAEDGTFYYVMEYLPGLTLDQLVKRHGPLPPGRAVHVLRELCGALREAHEAGLVHRDVKPGNVIVCRKGGVDDVVKLLDFGLVRPPAAEGAAAGLTQEGLVVGTPDFMAPEQALGAAALDARCDLYSLGALAYFLLTGRPPFVGRSALEVLDAHAHQPPAPLSDHRPDVPADLAADVLRCLAKDPAQRFPDADSLDRALAECACAGSWGKGEARRWWQAQKDEG
jgi:eukaryotic-like serine/threonine-protein kinase